MNGFWFEDTKVRLSDSIKLHEKSRKSSHHWQDFWCCFYPDEL